VMVALRFHLATVNPKMPSSERGLNTVGTAGTVLATVFPTAAIWNIGNRFFDTVDASYLYMHITTLIRTSIYAHIYTLIRTSIYAHIYTLIRTCDTYVSHTYRCRLLS
jgi:hypothetical protein